MTKKYFLYIFVLFLAFGYGFSVGFFKIFPFDQALSIKHYIEHKAGQFESQPVTKNKSVEIYNSFLSRLLLKRIQIPEYTGGGGGITNIENTLYIVSNKGSVLAYSLSEFSKFKTNIEEVPMNFGDLIQSGHPYDNDFRINWFRVNGVYAEKQDSLTHIMYVSHNAYDKDTDCITHNISRLKLKRRSENIIQEEEWHTILTASPC